MARTTPRTWDGEASLAPDVVARIHEQYVVSLKDEDKAGDAEDCAYYEGWREGLEWVLDLLHGVENQTLPEVLRDVVEGYEHTGNGRPPLRPGATAEEV